MRMSIESLKLKALVVVEAAGDECGKTVVQPTHGLRLALAFLYAVGDADRDLYDEFWRAVIDQPVSPHPRALGAAQAMQPLLNRIYRAVQVQRTPALMFGYAIRAKEKGDRR